MMDRPYRARRCAQCMPNLRGSEHLTMVPVSNRVRTAWCAHLREKRLGKGKRGMQIFEGTWSFAAIVPLYAAAMLRVAAALVGPAEAEDAVHCAGDCAHVAAACAWCDAFLQGRRDDKGDPA